MKARTGWISPALLGLSFALIPARSLPAAGFSYKEVARLGMATPGGNKLVNDFEPGVLSAAGDVAFVADDDVMGNGGNSSEGLFLATGGMLKAIFEPNKPVGPAAPDWTFVPMGPLGEVSSPVSMNAVGDLAFATDIQKKGDSTIMVGNFLWKQATGQMVPISLPGDDAGNGTKFGDATHGHSWDSVNDQGDVAFTVNVTDSAGDTAEGIYVRLADGTFHPIARPGDASPDGSTFASARRPNINNAGAVVFEGHTGADSSPGIFLFQSGKITAIATTSTAAPEGGKFTDLQSPRMNNNGQIIFLGDTGNGRGIYSFNGGKLSTVLAAGADLRSGAKLDQVSNQDGHQDGSLALSDSGEIAMHVDLAANGGHAIYLLHNGQLVPVAQDGDTLAGLGMADDTNSNHVAVNNMGQVAFQVAFHDGHTGLVLATPAP